MLQESEFNTIESSLELLTGDDFRRIWSDLLHSVNTCENKYDHSSWVEIQTAYKTAYFAHQFLPKKPNKAFRNTGEKFIEHPVAVAKLAVEHGLDARTISLALCHDVIEDTEIPPDFLSLAFSRSFTDSITRLTKIRNLNPTDDKGETRKRIFSGLIEDPRIIVIKLLDRIHNMRTISGIPQDSSRRIADETLQYFAPLAEVVGMDDVHDELVHRSLLVLDPNTAHEAEKKRSEYIKFASRLAPAVKAFLLHGMDKDSTQVEFNVIDFHLGNFIENTEGGKYTVTHIKPSYSVVVNDKSAFLRFIQQYSNEPIDDSEQVVDFVFNDVTVSLVIQEPHELDISLASLVDVYNWDTSQSPEDYDRIESLVNEKLSPIRALVSQLIRKQLSPKRFDELLSEIIHIFSRAHVRLHTPRGDIIFAPRDITAHEIAAYIHESIFLSLESVILDGDSVSFQQKVKHDQRVFCVPASKRKWTILPNSLDYISSERGLAYTKDALRYLIRVSTKARKFANDTNDLLDIDFYEDASTRTGHEELNDFNEYMNNFASQAVARGLKRLEEYYQEECGISDSPTFDFIKLWPNFAKQWKSSFYDWTEFLQYIGCELLEEHYIRDFIKSAQEFEKSLITSPIFIASDTVGSLEKILSSLRSSGINVANIRIVSNQPSKNPDATHIQITVYPHDNIHTPEDLLDVISGSQRGQNDSE